MRIDHSADHCTWDNTEPVSLEVPSRKGSRGYSVGVAKRRAVRGRERSPSGGVYLGFETRWLIPARELPEGERPDPGHVVIDGEGTRWTVLTADRNRAGQTHALGCVDLVLALGLRDLVAVERATIVYDDAGIPTKQEWKVLKVVQARVQIIDQEVASERGVRYDRERYEVTIDRDLEIDAAEDRLKWQDGATTRYLDIVAVRRGARIDELPLIEARDQS